MKTLLTESGAHRSMGFLSTILPTHNDADGKGGHWQRGAS
jgi:hypothetical protein